MWGHISAPQTATTRRVMYVRRQLSIKTVKHLRINHKQDMMRRSREQERRETGAAGRNYPGWTGVNERTFIAVKPDGVQRRLVGEIIHRFERKGFKLVGLKLVQASEELLKEHYWELRNRPFFKGLINYMRSGPVVAMVWEGLDVVKTARKMLGETNPADSLPGTIRGDFCVEVGRNVIHGSDSVESAQKEISLWFHQNELQCWEDESSRWIYN
ncbi:nucleoside diphosphate kinase 3 isoform X1 [Cheilinus undulatus]|uniref:nucleoside diphosphate kinase 3 isoform X1 n=1 Tax=Cheilinus undulatus TaxID=241271 RepID=UPI001BD64084|nr:nucleoside diphosphate kinase 3 isoform X1 [Cheilinus undulatus]